MTIAVLSQPERIWLTALRLAWAWRNLGPGRAARIDRLLAPVVCGRLGTEFCALVEALEQARVPVLYIEAFDHPEPTGDEAELLAALRCCYMDDPVAACDALAGLFVDGQNERVLERMQRIAAITRLRRLPVSVRPPVRESHRAPGGPRRDDPDRPGRRMH